MISNYDAILEYKPELDVLMVVTEVPDKYVLRWHEHQHESVLPLVNLLGSFDFFIGVQLDRGFHIAIVEFGVEHYWRVSTLINEIGEFIQWSKVTHQYNRGDRYR